MQKKTYLVRSPGTLTVDESGIRDNAFAAARPGTTYTFRAATGPDEKQWNELLDIPSGRFMEAWLLVEGAFGCGDLEDPCTEEAFIELAKLRNWPLKSDGPRKGGAAKRGHRKANEEEVINAYRAKRAQSPALSKKRVCELVASQFDLSWKTVSRYVGDTRDVLDK